MSDRRTIPLCHRTGRTLAAAALLLMPLLAARTTAAQPPPHPLRIAAAADLEPVLPALLTAFERETHTAAVASYASSATLATQIENGAPFDLFLSADMGFPQRLVEHGLNAPGAVPHAYARGTLVLWSPSAHPVSLDQLAGPQVHSIAIANPQHAPYGRAAAEALTARHLLPAVQDKLRTAENIAQAGQFVSSGNAEVGFLSLTLVRAWKGQGHAEVVPQRDYNPLLQGALVLRHGAHVAAALTFEQYLHSPAVQAELSRRGLEPAP